MAALPEDKDCHTGLVPRVSSCRGQGFKMNPAKSDGVGRVSFPGARGRPFWSREADGDMRA